MSTERQKLVYIRGAMVRRCHNRSDKAFRNYGARGIFVCARWLESAQNFIDDMSPRPLGSLLDRIDNDGPYSPENCRWATRQEQNSNRRNCIYVLDGTERITLKEACRRKGLTYRPIVKRIRYRGWPIERALSEPLKASPNSTP